MEKKVRDFVYLDTNRYISLHLMRTFYWGIIIIPFMMVVMGVATRSLFPLISMAIWTLLYWSFVLVIQSKRVKKTFELRFLVNGVMGVLLSSLFWILLAAITLASDSPLWKFDFPLWVLFFYLLFAVIYVSLIIFGVHKGVYSKIKKKSKSKMALAVMGGSAAIFPLMGVAGMNASKFLRAHATKSVQTTFMLIGFILIVFLPALAHINFVQYYYCKKYGITCDEEGNNTSPELERKPKKSKLLQQKKRYDGAVKKKFPLTLKILIGIAGIIMIIARLLIICVAVAAIAALLK